MDPAHSAIELNDLLKTTPGGRRRRRSEASRSGSRAARSSARSAASVPLALFRWRGIRAIRLLIRFDVARGTCECCSPSRPVLWDRSWPTPAAGGERVCLVWSRSAGHVQQTLHGSYARNLAHGLFDFEHGIRVVQLPTKNHRRILDLEVQAAVRDRAVAEELAFDTVEKRPVVSKLRPLTSHQVASPGHERVEPVSGLARKTPGRHSHKVTGSFNNPDAPSLAVVRVEKIGRHCRTRGQHRCSDPRSLCHAINTPVVTA